MSIEELGQIRTESNLKTTINLTLVDESDFDADKLEKYFDKKHFFVKLSQYFCIRCNPDLTETGDFTHKIYVAVFSKRYFYRDIVFEWAYVNSVI